MTVMAEGDGGLSAKSPSASVDATARRLTILIVTPEYTDDHQTERRLGDFSMLPKGIRLRLGYASTTVVHPDWQLQKHNHTQHQDRRYWIGRRTVGDHQHGRGQPAGAEVVLSFASRNCK